MIFLKKYPGLWPRLLRSEVIRILVTRMRVQPELNFNAETLVDLISWEEASEPIFTCDLSKDQLVEIRDKPLEVEYYCNHTQVIERAVKEVTEALGSVFGQDRRDGFIRGRAAHRELLNSKQDLRTLGKSKEI